MAAVNCDDCAYVPSSGNINWNVKHSLFVHWKCFHCPLDRSAIADFHCDDYSHYAIIKTELAMHWKLAHCLSDSPITLGRDEAEFPESLDVKAQLQARCEFL